MLTRKRKWAILHRFEQKQKKLLLSKLTVMDSFKILGELYQFAQKLDNGGNYNNLNIKRVQVLARVHSIFQKVTQ